MPAQLIFASVPSGRSPGRSGYCTAARSRTLNERLVAEIERHSAHEPGRGEAYAFRLLHAGDQTVALLTRFTDAGPDYTGRASTLAHHLIFFPADRVGAPPPADLARRFTGWRDRWDEPAAWIDDAPPALAPAPARLPAEHWRRLTGDAGLAATLVDDDGRPRAGTAPHPQPREALALFAESALLLGDSGWSAPFTTRDAAHDSGSLWRVGDGLAAGARPAGRRAVLARTGVLPGARPEPARPAPRGLPGPTAPEPADAPRPRIHAAYAVAAAAAACIPAAVYFALRTEPAHDPEPAPTMPAAKSPAPLASAVRTAMDHADAGDWFAFHEACRALTPAERELSPLAERVARFRRRLVADTLGRLDTRLTEARTALPPAERAEFRARLAALDALTAAQGIAQSGPETETRRDLTDALALMDALDVLPDNLVWITPRWIVAEETPLAVTRTVILANPDPLAAWFRDVAPPLRAELETDEGPGAPRPGAQPPLTLRAAALDITPGQIIALRHAEWGRILELRAESENRIRLTLRSPNGADRRLTDPGAPLRITLRGPQGKTDCTLLLNPGAAQTPVRAPARLLRRTAAGIGLPGWLEGRIRTLTAASGSAPGLLPHGFESAPRDFPRPPVGTAIVAQALRTRILRAEAGGAPPAEVSRLRDRLAAVAADPLAYGAPWTLVLTPPGADAPTPIIRFAP